MKTLHGVVRGRSIMLEEETGLTDGQAVEVVVTPSRSVSAEWGECVRQSAGGWAGFPEIDAVIEEIARGRKRERPPQ